jgi:O-antigen ligase
LALVGFLPLLALLAKDIRPEPRQPAIALVVIAMLIAPLLVSLGLHASAYGPFELALNLSRIGAVALYLVLAAVIAMHPGRERLLAVALPTLAVILAATFVVSALVFPHWHWGRLKPADMQPNWWGEVLVAVIFGACFVSTRVVRYGLQLLALVAIVVVQSRSALLAALPLTLMSVWLRETPRRMIVGAVVLLVVVAPPLLTLDLLAAERSWLQRGVDFVANDIFLLNDPHRGLDSGATGRLDGWLVALELAWAHPLLGVGFGRASPVVAAETGTSLHNGHLMMLVDTGIVLYGIIVMVVIATFAAGLRRDRRIFATMLFGFVLVMFVQPRAINANVMSMLGWMSLVFVWLLPSAHATAAERPSTSASQMRPGARWRRTALAGTAEPRPTSSAVHPLRR